MLAQTTEKQDEMIGVMISEGFTSGSMDGVSWEIEYSKHDWEDEDDIYYIAGLIKKGFTSGYYPSWTLKIK